MNDFTEWRMIVLSIGVGRWYGRLSPNLHLVARPSRPPWGNSLSGLRGGREKEYMGT